MAERTLLLHWNEISVPEDATPEDLERNAAWSELARSAFESFFRAQKARPDVRLSFSRGVFHGHVAGRPFQGWLEHWLGKERVQKLKARAVQPFHYAPVPVEQLDCELSVRGRSGEGITRAHLAESWAWSLGVPETGAAGDAIFADKMTIDGDGTTQVAVRNLATAPHGERWAQELVEWGLHPSANHTIAEFDGLRIIMYPLDHGYAHVHVRACNEPSLNAKYRVDKFEPLTDMNPPGLDTLMESWIVKHRELLLQSWLRCQAGKLPLQL
ncbi:hypothetical protein [Polaromonas sp. YR568]|uniref:hypothetical protein n=1 Tax=Polaromonas sp. YR568 TaxID=1855301 RepID=UPI0031383DB9